MKKRIVTITMAAAMTVSILGSAVVTGLAPAKQAVAETVRGADLFKKTAGEETFQIKGTKAATKGFTSTLYCKETVNNTSTEVSNVVWSSADESIATVTADGVVTGVNYGVTTITAVYGDKTASAEYHVVKNEVEEKIDLAVKNHKARVVKTLSYDKKGNLILKIKFTNKTGKTDTVRTIYSNKLTSMIIITEKEDFSGQKAVFKYNIGKYMDKMNDTKLKAHKSKTFTIKISKKKLKGKVYDLPAHTVGVTGCFGTSACGGYDNTYFIMFNEEQNNQYEPPYVTR